MFKKIFCGIFFFLICNAPGQAQEFLLYQPVAGVAVSGNNVLTENYIWALVSRNVQPGQRIEQDAVQSDLEALFATGYFQTVSVNYLSMREGVQVVYLLAENPVIRQVAISGNVSFAGEYILSLMKNRPGNVLNYPLLDQDIKKIDQVYKDAGYELSQVSDMFFDRRTGTLFVKIMEARLGRIEIKGIEQLRGQLLYRELSSVTGDVFNSNKLRQDRNNMLKTGLLGSVSAPLLEISPEPGRVNVAFDVQEHKTNQINFGYGLSSQEQFGFAKLTLLNFFGWGETMTLRAQSGFELGKEKQTYLFRFYTPWVLDRKISFAYERYLKQGYEALAQNGEIVDYLEIKRVGWGAEIGWLAFEPWFFSTEYYEEDVSTVAYDPPIQYTKKSAALVFVYNTVGQDIYNNPASGEYSKLRLEGGGLLGTVFGRELDLGGRTFGRYDMSYSRYLSFDLGRIIAVRAQAGIFNVDEAGPILEIEQYAVGGSNTVRGYLDIYPFAVGTRKFVINLEYRHTFNSWLQGVLFYDWGSAFDLGPVYANNFRSGKGIGVRFGTPLGPLRFDWAFGEDYTDVQAREHYDEHIPRNVLHFSLGQTF